MPVVPHGVIQRLRAKYPLPNIDQAWLQACYDWVIGEFHLQPAQTDEICMNVEAQLLASDLRDSMVPESGLPRNVSQIDKGRIAAQQSVLCQIMAITDIGNSAFSLQNVRQTRIDQADLAGLAEQAEEEDGEDYVIPKYPRSMLRFILCDGSVNIHAFECRRLPGLELGVTPLGCKMLLKNTLVRNGLVFLEPATVTVLPDSRADELEANQDADFARGLRLRMGLPEPDPEDVIEQPPHPRPPPAPAANNQPVQPQRRPVEQNHDNNVPNGGDDSYDFDDDFFSFDDDVIESLDALEARPQPPPQQRRPQIVDEVIEIDESDDDKENMPPAYAPPRRPMTPEVIEILSD